MSDKDIKFNIKAGLDASALDRQINQIKQKLQGLTQNQGYSEKAKQLFGDSSPMGQAAQKVFQRERQADIRKLTSEYGNMDKVVGKIEKRMESIKKQMAGQTEEVKKQSQMQLDSMNRQQASIKRGQVDIAGTLQNQGMTPSGAPIQQQSLMQRMRGALAGVTAANMGKGLMAFGGAAAGGMSMYGQYLGHQQTRDREVMSNLGRSTQAANIGFQSTMGGKGYQNFFESGERSDAMEMALGERSTRMEKDIVGSIGRALTKTLGGAAGGALMGGIPGAVIGGAVGLGSEMFGNKGTFRQMFDREGYMSEVNAETMQNFRGNLTARKLADPTKFAAEQVFGKNQGAFQSVQRQLGIGDDELLGGGVSAIPSERLTGSQMTSEQRSRGTSKFNQATGKYEISESDSDFESRKQKVMNENADRQKGFLERQMSADGLGGDPAFSQQRILQNITSILGAGGTTQFAKGGGSNLSARLQQQGMTGAAGELGALSGLGGGDSTEDAYKRLLSEAMTTGIDASEMKAEMRQFSKAAVQIMMRTEGAEGAVSTFAQSMVGTSSVDMMAAQNAMGMMNQEAGQGGGARGAMKWAFLNSQEGQEFFEGSDMEFGELENMKAYMTSANIENLDEDDIMVKRMAQSSGKSPKEVLEFMQKVQGKGMNFTEEADVAQKKFEKAFKASGMSEEDFINSEEGIKLGSQAFGSIGLERGDAFRQQGKETKEASLYGRSVTADLSKKKGFEIGKGTATTLADKGEASQAKDQVAQLSILNEKMGELGSAMDMNRKESLANTKAIQINATATKALTSFLEKGGTFSTETLDQLTKDLSGRSQPTTGKPK